MNKSLKLFQVLFGGEREGREGILRDWISFPQMASRVDIHGNTSLHYMALGGFAEGVRFLYSFIYDSMRADCLCFSQFVKLVEKTNLKNQTAFAIASLLGKEGVIQEFKKLEEFVQVGHLLDDLDWRDIPISEIEEKNCFSESQFARFSSDYYVGVWNCFVQSVTAEKLDKVLWISQVFF